MTFLEALQNEVTRRMIDAIEDIRCSLDGCEDDEILQDCLAEACFALHAATGVDLS